MRYPEDQIAHILSCDCAGCTAVAAATRRLEMVKQEREYRVGMAGVKLATGDLFAEDIANTPSEPYESQPELVAILLTDVDMCMRCGQHPAPRVFGLRNTFVFDTPPPGEYATPPGANGYVQTLCPHCIADLED